jgi:hypothetical protein
MSTNPITVEALPPYTGLDGDNAENYYRAGQRLALLQDEVMNPFEDALKDETGYNEGRIPRKEKEIDVHSGRYVFGLKVTPTAKRPGYKELVEDLQNFLDGRLQQYKAGERPVGILTIGGQPYIRVDDVLSRIEDGRETVLSKGTKIAIARRPALRANAPFVIPLGMDLYELSGGNAKRYLQAFGMCMEYGRIISSFENDLLGEAGFTDESPPDRTEHMYKAIGNHIFHVKTVPYESTSWGKILEGLDKPIPKKKVDNAGDLTLIKEGIQIPRLAPYDARKRDGQPLVRLEGLITRMYDLFFDNTQTAIRQKPINHYPIV